MNVVKAICLLAMAAVQSCGQCSHAWAQFTVADSYPADEPIMLMVDPPKDAGTVQEITWEIEGPGRYREISVRNSDGSLSDGIVIANAPGQYTYRVEVALYRDIEDKDGKHWQARIAGGFKKSGKFRVLPSGVGPGPAPGPVPNDNSPLAVKMSEAFAKLRAAYADVFTAHAAQVRSGTLATGPALQDAINLATRESRKTSLAPIDEHLNGISIVQPGDKLDAAQAASKLDELSQALRGN